MTTPPKRPIELVALANDNCLLPRLNLQYAFDLTFNIAGENTKTVVDKQDLFGRHRTKRVYIDKRGMITRAGNPYIQKLRLGFIDSNGDSHRWGSDFPEKMYLRFINIKSDEALDRFIEKTGFCVFPSVSETSFLCSEYEKKGLKFPRVFLPNKESDEERNHDLMEVFRVNKDFIKRKKDELKDLVDHFQKGTFRYDKLLWVNQQMENVSNILIDGKHFIWDEIQKGKKGRVTKDTRTNEEVLGLKQIQSLEIIPILRVYGHYAYCCYEFFLDILEKNKILVCQNCERYFQPNRKGQFLCKEPSCIKSRNSKIKAIK